VAERSAPQRSQTESLSITDAIARTRQQYPLLIAAKQRIAMAEGERVEAGLRLNPSLTVSGENFPLDPPVNGFAFDRTIDWFATYSQTFERGNKRALRLALAERNVEAAQAEVAALEKQLVYEVKAAYQKAAFERLRVELLRENLNNLQQLVKLNEVRVREGYTAEGDLIKVRVEAQRFDYQLRKAALDYDKAKIALLNALGASSFELADTEFELADPLDFQTVAFDPVHLQEAALRQPQLLAAQTRVERARAQLQLQQAQARPDVTATFGYKRNGVDNALFGALSVPLPLYNRNQGMIARAQAEIEVAEAEVRHLRNQLLAELAAARRAVTLHQQLVETLRADFLLQADEARNVSLAAYREGASDLLMVLDAQRTRSQAQELYFQALYDYQIAVHELERAAGSERLPTRASGIQTSNEKP
jgi:outer membrane protein, heavy metal efflux system